jgi:pyruvate formate lyase activating enzyme
MLPVLAPTLAVGGFQPFSTTDWPGRLAAVVFVQGCPWRCGYCHNPGLQARARPPATPDWPAVLRTLQRRVGLLDGVVFSGGEPTLDPALPAAVDAVRALGFAVGLHTAGIYPQRLQALLPRLDWVGLDLKCDAAAYDDLTGVRGSAAPAQQALALLAASGVALEVRTTCDPRWVDEAALAAMAVQLQDAGVTRWVLQRCRDAGGQAMVPSVSPSALPSVPGLAVDWR